MTASLALALLTAAILIAMSLAAGRRIAPGKKRLAMQWNLKGEPTWFLPRRLALGFTPALAAIVLIVLAIFASVETGAMLAVAVALIAAHALHLVLLSRRS